VVGHDIGGAIVLRAHLLEGWPVSRIALIDAVTLNPWNTPTTIHMRSHLDTYRTMPSHIYEEVVKAHLRTAVHNGFDDEALAAYLAPWQERRDKPPTSARSRSGRMTMLALLNRCFRPSAYRCGFCGVKRMLA
jgi:hypothetical protein